MFPLARDSAHLVILLKLLRLPNGAVILSASLPH